MDQTHQPLPSPIVPTNDISVRLLKVESLLNSLSQSHEDLQIRVSSVVSALADINNRVGKPVESILEKDLIETILPSPSQDFLWKFTPTDQVPNPISKRKIVTFGFSLEAIGEVQLPSDEDISLTLHVLNSAKTRIIVSTMTGKSILSGGTGKASYSTARNRYTVTMCFSINEVSSHYELGRVTLLFQPQCPKHRELEELIQPFLVEDLVVRAKELTCIEP